MSLFESFEDVAVGDEVKISRGSSRDQISRVYHVTAKTFDVGGFGKFWKKGGIGYGDSTSYGWHARFAEHIQEGDGVRIAAHDGRLQKE